MVGFDKDTFDYIKGNLEREVRDNVEKRLFKTWTALAAAFLAGVGLVGTPWVLSYLDKQVSTVVERRVSEQVQAPTERARKLAEEAQTVAQTARDKISTAVAEVEARRKVVDDLLVELRTKSGVAGEQVEKLRSDFDLRSKTIDASLTSARNSVGEIADQAKQLSDRLRTAVPDAGVLASLTVDVKSLVDEVARLDTELKRVSDKTAVAEKPERAETAQPAETAPRAEIAELARTASARTQAVQANAPSTTVYVQFAGAVNRDVIKTISARLIQGGWKVPGEERIASAATLHEIRCFYDTDCKNAEALRDQLNAIFGELYNSNKYNVTIKPRLTYSPKPRQGILEVWVELPNPA